MIKNLPVDHILYGVPDLDWGIEHIHTITGIKPVIGGKHLGLGTHNALLGLGEIPYLEIIAPDPDQHVDRVWMDLDKLLEPKLFRWAAYSSSIAGIRNLALANGLDIGEVKSGTRKTPSGSLLEWQLTDPSIILGDGLVPFFIDWGANGNPTPTLPQGCRLKQLSAEHPNPSHIQEVLDILQLGLHIQHSDQIRLSATIETPLGSIDLR